MLTTVGPCLSARSVKSGSSRASHGANQLGHGAKSGGTGADRPAGFGQIGAGSPRILDAPVPAFAEIARLQLIAADRAADLELRECELLHQLVFLIEGFRLEQHARVEIRPEPVTVSHPVFRLQCEDLATVAPDALDLALSDGVVLRHVLELLRKYRGKRPAAGLLVDLHRQARGQVAHDLVAGADDLARHSVQGFQPLARYRSLDDVSNAGGFELLALLVYERA